MPNAHEAVEGSEWGKWKCSCGWKPTARSLGIQRGYGQLTAVSFHIAEKEGRLCLCRCELNYHYAGHGKCKNETRYQGPECSCKKFRRKKTA